MSQQPLLDIKAVAARLGVSVATVYRMIERAELSPPIRIGPRRALWEPSEIEAYIASRSDLSKRGLLPIPELALENRSLRRKADAEEKCLLGAERDKPATAE